MQFFNLFQLLSNDRCIHYECLFKIMCSLERVIAENLLHPLYFPPVFLNNVSHDVIYLVNTDSIFNFNYVNV